MVLGVLVIVVAGTLVFNYFKNTKGTNLFNTKKEIVTEATVKGEHTVAKGESLWKIAQNYYGDGYKWVEIAKANNIKNADAIEVGQKLTLPDLKGNSVKQESKENQKETISGATYQVVKNDSLWSIAVRAYGDGYKWVEIARENKLTNPNMIYTGNVLVLPR